VVREAAAPFVQWLGQAEEEAEGPKPEEQKALDQAKSSEAKSSQAEEEEEDAALE
jgi:hypothetical protein